jgi:hypothetical protein
VADRAASAAIARAREIIVLNDNRNVRS